MGKLRFREVNFPEVCERVSESGFRWRQNGCIGDTSSHWTGCGDSEAGPRQVSHPAQCLSSPVLCQLVHCGVWCGSITWVRFMTSHFLWASVSLPVKCHCLQTHFSSDVSLRHTVMLYQSKNWFLTSVSVNKWFLGTHQDIYLNQNVIG